MALSSYLRSTAVALITACTLPFAAAAGQPVSGPQETAAIEQFDAAIARYMALRQRLLAELPGPTANSTATKLTQASDALAAAIRRSRPNPSVGALFVAPVAPVIKRRIDDTVRREQLGPMLTDIDDEQAKPLKPAIYLSFPSEKQMATMPPSLLAVLPRLPKALEYRIVGEYLILRDVDAAMILDYIPAAVPR